MADNKEAQIEKQFVNKFVKLIGKDMIRYVPAKIIPAIIGVISIPVFTNIFPPDEYGIYSMAVSAVSLVSNILTGWLAFSALRFYDQFKDENKEKTFFTTIFTTLFAINLMIVLLGIISYTLLNDVIVDYKYIFLFSFFILLSAPFMKITKKILRADRDINIYSFLTILLPSGKLALVLLFNQYLNFLGVSMLLLATIITEILIVLIAILRIKPDFNFSYFNKNFSIKIFKYGFPLMFTSILTWILSVSDRYIIGFLRSSEEVGFYSISYSIGSQSLNLIVMMLMLAAFPIIIKAWNNHDKKYISVLLSRLVKYYYVLTVPIVMALFVLSPMLIEILSSEEYHQGYLVMPWIGLGIFFMGLSQYIHKIWELNEDTRFIMVLNFVSAIINLILNFIFVPKFGFIAAGFSTFISYLFYCIIAYFMSKKYIKIDIFNINTIKIIISGFIMLLPVYFLNINLENNIFSFILIVLIGALIYFILLYLFNVIRREVNIAKDIILN